MKNEKQIPLLIMRGILGMTFLFSGWVKAVDPFGFSLKINEFITTLNLSQLSFFSSGFSILLSAFELFLGMMMLCGLFRKTISLLFLFFMFSFTLFTACIYLNPNLNIVDCGCFGDFMHLTNGETFLKNIILLALSIYYYLQTKKRNFPKIRFHYVISGYLLIGALLLPLYSSIFLPIYDFLPFNRGEQLNTLQHDDNSSNLNFMILDDQYNTITSDILNHSERQFIVINNSDDPLNSEDIEKLQSIHKLSEDNNIDMIIVSLAEAALFEKEKIGNVRYGIMDGTVMKSIVRCDLGLILIDNQKIIGKWNIQAKSFKNRSINQLIKSQQTLTMKFYLSILLFATGLILLIKHKRNSYEE